MPENPSRFTNSPNTRSLPEGVEPGTLATYVIALSQGIAVEAASGIPRAELNAMIDLALKRLPWE
jgi:hypothetical protein